MTHCFGCPDQFVYMSISIVVGINLWRFCLFQGVFQGCHPAVICIGFFLPACMPDPYIGTQIGIRLMKKIKSKQIKILKAAVIISFQVYYFPKIQFWLQALFAWNHKISCSKVIQGPLSFEDRSDISIFHQSLHNNNR